MATTDKDDVRELLDAQGNSFAFYAYDAYGNPTPAVTATTSLIPSAAIVSAIATRQPLRYASYVYDSESGLYYLSARYYDPSTMQFVSRDAAKADGEEGLYQYCGGDPVNLVDPDGNEPHTYNSADGYGSSGYSHGYDHHTPHVDARREPLRQGTHRLLPRAESRTQSGAREEDSARAGRRAAHQAQPRGGAQESDSKGESA